MTFYKVEQVYCTFEQMMDQEKFQLLVVEFVEKSSRMLTSISNTQEAMSARMIGIESRLERIESRLEKIEDRLRKIELFVPTENADFLSTKAKA